MYLILGGNSDLAKEIIKKLIKKDDMIVTYRSNKNLEKIKSKKKKIIYQKLDLNKLKSIKIFVKKNLNLLNNIKVINLATLSIDKLTHNIDYNDLTKVFNINNFSNILLAKELIPLMIRQNYGKFIFFTSTRATRGDIGISLYSSSKEGLSGFSRSLAKEYAVFNITSNCIQLGYFKSKLFNNIKEDTKKKLIQQIPSKKLGKTNDIIEVINLITKTNYINGSDIVVNGGI